MHTTHSFRVRRYGLEKSTWSRKNTRMNTFTEIVLPDLLGTTPLEKNMTFAVKANISSGYRSSASTPSLRDWVPRNISSVVGALVNQGHCIVAIANMHELASGITSENPVFGDVDNPQKAGYIAGGSSGGSAAAVAMNAVSFALGTDTGGSVRIPAALCGVVGYRPTTGLYDSSDVCPLSSTTDTIGTIAQTVETVQLVHKTIVPSYTPTIEPLQGKRIGVPRKYFYDVLDSEVLRLTEAALLSLRTGGAELVEVDFPADFMKDFMPPFLNVVNFELNHLIESYLKDKGAPVNYEELCKQIGDPSVRNAFSAASKVTDEQYQHSQKQFEKLRQMYHDYFENNHLDCFVCPTTILPAVKRPSAKTVTVRGQEIPTLLAFIHNTTPQAAAGVPSVSLPSGATSDGLPVGLEVVAAHGKDGELLDIAAAIQKILPSLPMLSFADFRSVL